ncbi:MAG: SEL1-like repeat protein, partial [Succinivibrionaceae bacterium]|nr:SEL1-like repeat protein [Succinivibrionaceae bacterium]
METMGNNGYQPSIPELDDALTGTEVQTAAERGSETVVGTAAEPAVETVPESAAETVSATAASGITEEQHSEETVQNSGADAVASVQEEQTPKEDPSICFLQGHKYLVGDGVRKDTRKAVALFERAIQLNNFEAAEYLGIQYYQGKNLRTNLKKSFDYFKLAADNGLSFSQFWTGFFYDDGETVDRNIGEAVRYYTMSAESNFTTVDQLLAAAFCFQNAKTDDCDAGVNSQYSH